MIFSLFGRLFSSAPLRVLVTTLVVVSQLCLPTATSFSTTWATRFRDRNFAASKHFYSNDYYGSAGDYAGGSEADEAWRILKVRLQRLRLDVLETELQRPPNPQLSACDFVQLLLQCILEYEDPLPEAGFRLLLRTATEDWKRTLYKSVGAPGHANEEVVASALGGAIARPDNQYALLVGEAEDYVISFPFEPLDYYDGTAWVECRLRDKQTNSLLVTTGWELRQNKEGAWMVAGLDWHDFRDRYRPGVGREEWMRLCQ
jgi:hypothetical protein